MSTTAHFDHEIFRTTETVGAMAASADPNSFDFGDHVDKESFTQILEMDDNDPDHSFSKSIISDYFEQAKSTFLKMDEALVNKDLKSLSEAGHFLKGSSATLGFQKVRDQCQIIQQYGKKKNLDGSDGPDVEVCLQRITEAIKSAKLNENIIEEQVQKFYQQF